MAKGKIVKKRWVPIVAPKIFGGRQLGDTYISTPQESIGKTVETSFASITGDPQKQPIILKFSIKDFTGDKYNTEIISYHISPSAVRKMMRRARNKIDDSFTLKTKDGKIIRIKPMLITRTRATGSVLASLGNTARDFLARATAKLDYENLMHEIVEKKLQRSMNQVLRKVFPLSIAEIRECVYIPQEIAEKQKIQVIKPKPEKAAPKEKPEEPKAAEAKEAEKPAEPEKPKSEKAEEEK